jgi:hypothetical protein
MQVQRKSLKIPIKILQMKMHFLSPTLNIAPTDNQMHFAGLKGKLTTN